ncbi:MAG: peptidylprolyl isomerase [Cyclonatronaceae bacterium]
MAVIILSSALQARQARVSDQIVAVVNQNIILKSEVDDRLREFLSVNQQVPYTENLWYEMLESMVDNFVLFEQAKIDSIIVSDDMVNRQLDQRIRQLVQQLGSESELEAMMGRSIPQIRQEYRSQFRQEIMVERLRELQRSKIRITRPEVLEFFNTIPADSLPVIPETVELAQIVSIPPPLAEARSLAYNKAVALRDSILNHGASIEELARKHSDGPSGPDGGLLPMMPMSDLVAEFSAAAAALEPGGISEVVETEFGFHIIRLNRRVGDRIETNHILIQVSEDQLDERFSINLLETLRDSVLTHGASFSALARRHSDDKLTAPAGGRLINPQTGERRIVLNQLDPALYRIVLLLEEPGDISPPRAFNIDGDRKRAHRIVQLLNRVPEHKANLRQDYDLIERIALSQKQARELASWLTRLREDIYVEYKITNPYASR